VLAFGADGLGHVGPVESTAAIAVLDVLAKTAFGLMAVTRNRRLVAEDLEPREGRPRVVGVRAVRAEDGAAAACDAIEALLAQAPAR
jgi:bacteriorhodopsin